MKLLVLSLRKEGEGAREVSVLVAECKKIRSPRERRVLSMDFILPVWHRRGEYHM